MRIISSENKTINESKGYSKRSLLRIIFVGGLLAALFIAPFLRGLYFEQDLLPIIMLVALSFACCVGEWLFQRDDQFFNHPLDWAMLALLIIYLLSLINAVHIHQALLAILSVASFFMVYWMAGQATKNESDFNRLLLVVYLMAIGLSMVGMGAAAGLVDLPAAYEDGHIRSALQYHNTLAIYLAGLSFVGLALSIRSERKISRLAYAAGNLILVMAIIGTISRGTWLIYPLGFMLFIILIGKQHWRDALLNWAIFFFCGLVAGLGFLNRVSQGQETSALIFAAAGLLAAAFMQWLADSIKFADKSGEGQKNLYCIAGRPQLVVAGLVLTAGLIHMLLSFSGSSTQFVPREISAKVEKTSLQDNSINDRLTFYQDALKISVDYPLLGAGGGGWEALYHSYAQRLYWSREVHSYYLQTLVETGILGLLALLLIAALFIKLLIDQRQRDKAGSLSNLTLWGAATAVIMFGMHSGMDADFSLPSTGLLFYALVGAIKGRTMEHVPAGLERKKPKEKNESRKSNRKEIFGLLGITVALIVFGGAGVLRQAAILGEAGAQALEKRDVDRAAILYQKAAKLDPWRATYQINLAQIEAIKADKNQDGKARVAAKGYAVRAAELEPYNSKVRRALVDIYGMLHEGDLRIAESKALVKANPLLEPSYEVLAANVMNAAWYFLSNDKRNQADIYFAQVMDIREKLPVGAGPPGDGLNLVAGQAAVCMGRNEQAMELLQQLGKMENEQGANARIWLAATCTMAGDKAGANTYLEELAMQDKAAHLKYQSIIGILGSDVSK